MGIMKLAMLIITISSFHFVVSEVVWKEVEGEVDMDYSENNEIVGDVFSDFSPKDIFKRNERRKFSTYNKTPNSIMNTKKSKKDIYQYGRSPTPCSCFVKYTLLELGYMYSPRKILTTVCDSNKCGNFYQCNEKKYGVTVMKKKSKMDRTSAHSPALPRGLDYPWVPEVKYVTVACECLEI